MVHYVFEVKNFDLSRWRQSNLLIKIARKTILDFVFLFALQFYLLGKFVLLVDQNTDILSHTWLKTVVLVNFAHV